MTNPMLAQVQEIPELPRGPQNVPERVTNFMDQLRSFRLPSQEDLVNHLATLNVIQGILLLAFGLVYLLQGWKIFKILVVVNATVIGALLGSYLGGLVKGPNMPLFGGIGGGLLLGVLAWPLMKYAVSLMGGLAGSFVGFIVWKHAAEAAGRPHLVEYAWAGALVGLILLGMLAFIILKLTVEILTSVQGAMMTVTGIIALLMKHEQISQSFHQALHDHAHLMPLLVSVPAIIGFAIQHTSSSKGKKKPPSG